MGKRLIQVSGLLVSTLGWLFVLCTIGMDFWKLSQVGGMGGSFIITVSWVWSNLWHDCFTNSAAVDNCIDYAYVWPLFYYVQVVQGLLFCGCSIGLAGAVLCFLGMECTYIGGDETKKDRLLFAGAVVHFIGGTAAMSAYCIYYNWTIRTSLPSNVQPAGSIEFSLFLYQLVFVVGPPVILGFIGSLLIYLGAIFYAVTVYKSVLPERKVAINGQRTYMETRSGGRTYTDYYYRPSSQYGYYMGSGRSSSSRVSKLSQTTPERMSERDAYV